jgi:hypothetical protein
VPAILPEEHPWDSPEAFRDYVGRFGELGIEEFILQSPPDLPRERVEELLLETGSRAPGRKDERGLGRRG